MAGTSFDAFVLQVDVFDIDMDGHHDVLMMAAMQTVIALSDGSTSFKLLYGGYSGLGGAASLVPYSDHAQNDDICVPSSPSKGVVQGEAVARR